MDWTQTISVSLGVLGSVLGVSNFIRSIRDDRVRLRVIPVLAWARGESTMFLHASPRTREVISEFGMPTLGVEIINLSKFPVTITEVGLCEGTMKIERAPFHQART